LDHNRIGGTDVASDRNRQTVSFEELAYSNMLQVQALVELLEEKGLLTRREVLERVKQPLAEMRESPERGALQFRFVDGMGDTHHLAESDGATDPDQPCIDRGFRGLAVVVALLPVLQFVHLILPKSAL